MTGKPVAKEAYDDLATRFLDALVTVLIDFPPTYGGALLWERCATGWRGGRC